MLCYFTNYARNRITNFSLMLKKKIGISTLNFQIILQKSHGELFDCPINMGKLSTYDFGKSHGEWFDCPINMGKLSTYDSFKIIRRSNRNQMVKCICNDKLIYH